MYAYIAAVLFMLHLIKCVYRGFQFSPDVLFGFLKPSEDGSGFFLFEWVKLVLVFFLKPVDFLDFNMDDEQKAMGTCVIPEPEM